MRSSGTNLLWNGWSTKNLEPRKNPAPSTPPPPPRNGILVEGTKGRIFVNRGTIAGKPIEDLESNPLPGDWLEELYRGKLVGHMQNFFDCLANRQRPASDVWTHVAGINTCHLSNIAIRLNRQIEWDAKTQTVKGDAVANDMQARPSRKGYEIEL